MITTKKKLILSVSFLLLRRRCGIFLPEEPFYHAEKPSHHTGKPFNRFQTLEKFNQLITTRSVMKEPGAKCQKPQRNPVVPGQNATSGSGIQWYGRETQHPAAKCHCTTAERKIRQRNGIVRCTTTFRTGTAHSATVFGE